MRKTVKYDSLTWKGEYKKKVQSIPQFAIEQTLFKEHYNSFYPERIQLEDQPTKIVDMVGRLMEKLIEKGIMNTQDLIDVLDSNIKDVEIINDD